MSISRHDQMPQPHSIEAIARSLLVARRAAFKLTIFVLFALGQMMAGNGFARPLGAMLVIASLFAVVIHHWLREPRMPPYFTSFDEAAWCLLLALAVHRYA